LHSVALAVYNESSLLKTISKRIKHYQREGKRPNELTAWSL